MAFIHGKASRLVLGVLAFSGFCKEMENGVEIDLADTTTFGNEGHRYTPGLEGGTLTLGGFLDSSPLAGGQHATLSDALGATAGTVITSGTNGLALGQPVKMIEARESAYPITNPVSEAVQFQSTWQSEGQVDDGVSLHDLTAESATLNGANVDNGALSSGGGALHLHVTANTRSTSTTIKVQHSVDNSVWVDLGSAFTAVGAGLTSAQRLVVAAGTVNRHLRAVWTLTAGTGSITFAVTAARR